MSGLDPEDLRRLLGGAADEASASSDALDSILSRGHRRRRRRHAVLGGAATILVVVAVVLGANLLRPGPATVPPATAAPTVSSTTPAKTPNAFVAQDGSGVVRMFDLMTGQAIGEPLKVANVLATDGTVVYSTDANRVLRSTGGVIASASPDSKLATLTVRADRVAFIEENGPSQQLVLQSGSRRDALDLPPKAFSFGATLAQDGTAAYLTNFTQGVYQLSTVSGGRVTNSVKLPAGCGYTGLTWVGSQLETVQTDCKTTKVLLIDPATGAVTAQTDAPDIGPFTTLTIDAADGVTVVSYLDRAKQAWRYRVDVNGQVRAFNPTCSDKTACPSGAAYLLTR